MYISYICLLHIHFFKIIYKIWKLFFHKINANHRIFHTKKDQTFQRKFTLSETQRVNHHLDTVFGPMLSVNTFELSSYFLIHKY